MPTLMTTYEAKKSFEFQRHIGSKPRETTLFIIIIIITCSNFENLTDNLESHVLFLTRLSHQYTRPKCLIVHFSKSKETYQKLLTTLWNQQFIDVTVLHLTNDNVILNRDLRRTKYVPTVHEFNKFCQIYTIRSPSTSLWFVDKEIYVTKQ